MNTITEGVRALSWKQPYASLMLLGKIETRTWHTAYRGLVLICASKIPYPENMVMDISGISETQRIFTSLNDAGIKEPTGMAIAIGRLVHCRPMTKQDEKDCYVQYFEPWTEQKENKRGFIIHREKRLYCHIYEDVRAIVPFEWKGTQGFQTLNYSTISKIRYK